MLLRAGPYEFLFPGPALIMGIVNVTPDSFSDGGMHFSTESAVQHAMRLVEEGADILDIGGESTRPQAIPVSVDEESRRVLPVIERLAGEVRVPISVDTMKPQVASDAVKAGATIINDVAANRTDPAMWRVVAESNAAYVVMHMQGTPQTMQSNPSYANVVEEVGAFFEDRLKELFRLGVKSDRVILDPGIGFGKTPDHNLQLLKGTKSFTKWGCPLLLGVSRKSFIQKATGGTQIEERLPGSLACACWGVLEGVNIIRTHDVLATRRAVTMLEAITKS